VDDVAFGALALTLTLLSGAWTVYAFRNRGAASGLRGAGVTLIPVGLWLTDSLRMVTRIGDAIGDWVTGIVLSPATWAGIIALGLGVVLIVVSGMVRSRQAPASPKVAKGSGRGELPKTSAPRGTQPPVDDDMAEIEALLRKRGIS
jgi:hypothetical protein